MKSRSLLFLRRFSPGLCGVVMFATRSDAQVAAFPGAVGFGATATGAATADANGKHTGGNVYHVTNLNDSGSGSFRDAVSVSGRVVVFDVGGYIHLLSAVSAKSNLTIAGQTAPGDGIGVYGAEVSFYGQSDLIVRHFRFRDGTADPNYPGSSSTNSHTNCVSLGATNNVIFDHCSMEFAAYNNVDAVGAVNLTIEYCIFADPIKEQQFNFHFEGGPATFIDNLWANNHGRSPLAKGNLQYVNNIDYNYQYAFCAGNTSGHFNFDIVNNYFIAGPSTSSPSDDYYQVPAGCNAYAIGNLLDGNKNGVLDGSADNSTGATVLSAYYFGSSAAVPTTALPTLAAANAYNFVLSNSGALPHDQVDAQVVSTVLTAGKSGQLWVSQTATGLGNGGYGVINGGTPPIDSDQDGMPDDWENAKGLNPASAADGKTTAASGYTNLEDYLNWLALPHAFVAKNGAVDIDLSVYAAGFPAGSTYTVSAATGGSATQTTAGGPVVHFVPTANTGPAIGGFTFSVSNGSYTMTTTCGVLVSGATATKDLLWLGDGTTNAWDGSTADWINESTATTSNFGGADRVTFDDTGSHSPAINITAVLSPSSIEVSTDALNYTFSGYGWLSGATALVKDGAGTLTIAPSIATTSGTLTAGSPTVMVGSTANLTVGMPVSGTAIGSLTSVPSGTTLLSFHASTGSGDASTVTLSKNAGATGTATLSFVPTNNYTGPTTFNAGTIVLNGGGTLGTGVMNLNGTLTNGASSSTTVGLSNAIVVAAGNTGTLNMGNRFALGGSVTGTGTLNLNVQTTLMRDDLTGAFAAFAGTTNFIGSGGVRLFFNGGSFDGFTNSTVNLPAGISLYPQTGSSGNTIGIGELDGAGNLYGGTAGAAVWSIGGLNTSFTFAGNILDSGTIKAGLTKVGTGTLTLTGTGSSFTGPLTVSAGTLATLGTFGGLVTVSGGTLSLGTPGASPGTLTANGGLTLAGATVAYDLSNSPSGANDSITAPTGTLVTLSGTDVFQINMVNGVLGAGTYTLVGGAATLGTSGVTLSLTTTPALPSGSRQTLALSRQGSGSSPAYVRLIVTGDVAALTWTGANNGVWDLSTTQSWTSTAPSNPNVFYNFDSASFTDSATSGTVTLSGTVQPNFISVNNGSVPYNFTGTGVIGGSTKLTKSGTGTLTISTTGANTFTGGTVMNAGLLSISSTGSALGTGPVAMNGGTLNLQNVTLPNAFVFTGTTALTTGTGNSQIVGSTANTMTSVGNAILDLSGVPGILSINGDMSGFTGRIAFGAATGTLRLNANTSYLNDVNTGSANAVFDLGSNRATLCNRNGGGTINLGALQSTGANTVLLGRQSGSGGYLNTTPVTFSGAGTGAAATATATDGVITSVTVTNGGSGYTTAPTVSFTSSTGSGATATATVSGGVVTGITVTNGGTGILTASNYVIGALNTDATFAGKITNSPGTTGGGDFLGLNIFKVGTGNWTLSGVSAFSGDMEVGAGTLTVSGALTNDGDFEVDANAALVLAGGTITTPTLTLDGSTMLTGYGTLNGGLVNQGTVALSAGTLTVNGAIENDGFMQVTSGATLAANGGFVNNGMLDIITGAANLPAGFVNNGTVLNSSSVQVQQISKNGTTISVAVQTYAGHNFTLQRSSSLTSPAWQTVQTQTGTGDVLSFSDSNSGAQGFYRFVVTP